MKVCAFSGLVLVVCRAVLAGGPFPGYVWTEQRPAGFEYTDFAFLAMSSDGSKLMASGENGALVMSSDSGATWNSVHPDSDPSLAWYSVSMSADGAVMLANSAWNRLYLSTDSGATWAETRPKGDIDTMWQTAISADAGVLLAMQTWGRVYKSTDLGAHWTEVQPAGNVDVGWYRGAIDPAGQTIILLDDSQHIYRTDDSGSHWAPITPPNPDEYWNALAMSADGTRIILGVDGGRLWRSADSGSSWTQLYPAGDTAQEWHSVAMSHDGLKIAVGNDTNGLFTSSDGGDTWIERHPAPGKYCEWNVLAMSPDGQRIFGGCNDGALYTAGPNPVPTAVTTALALNIQTAAVTGNVTDPGDSDVSTRGVCWNTSGNPTTADSHLDVGAGVGEFNALIIDLTPGTTYYVRTYAVNSQGTGYSVQESVTLPDANLPFWRLVTPAGNQPAGWFNGAISGDGSMLVAMEMLSRKVFTSQDFGYNWLASTSTFDFAPYAEAAVLSEIDLSSNGKVIAMTTGTPAPKGPVPKRPRGSQLYISTDTGATWVTPTSGTNYQWAGVVVSPDGQTIQSPNFMDEALYTSTDAGTTWTTVPFPRLYTTGICGSDDGSRLAMAAPYSDGNVFISSDAGQTWSIKTISDVDSIFSIACSSNGQILYAVGDPTLWISRDGGETWAAADPFGNRSIVGTRVACTPDGQTVLVGGLGRLALSLDGGTTWSSQLGRSTDIVEGGEGYSAWTVASVSTDGKRFLAGKVDGQFYVGEFPRLQTVTTGDISVVGTSAMVSGSVTTQDFVPVTACGACWNTTGSPTLNDAHTSDVLGSGDFSSIAGGLAPQTTYYVRAYATSALGTAYGQEKTVTALAPNLFLNISGDDDGNDGNYGVGDNANFLLDIGNSGNGPASGVNVRIPIPPGSQFVSGFFIMMSGIGRGDSQIALEGSDLLITIPQLDPGEQVQVRIVLRALVAGQISLTAQISSAEQPVPVTADPAVIDVQDDYYRIVRPVPLCGAIGIAPLIGAILSLGFIRRRFWS